MMCIEHDTFVGTSQRIFVEKLKNIPKLPIYSAQASRSPAQRGARDTTYVNIYYHRTVNLWKLRSK